MSSLGLTLSTDKNSPATAAAEDKFMLHSAIRENRDKVAETLLNNDSSLVNLRDDDDRLPQHWAAAYGVTPVVEQLVIMPKFDVDAPDGLGWTALMMACSSKQNAEEIVDILLRAGADPSVKNKNGQTALHFAASKKQFDIAKKLIAQSPGCARLRDQRNQLPLHRAASVGSAAIIRLLLDKGSPIDVQDTDGLTALHHSVAEGWADCAEVLIERGADPLIKSNDGFVAVELALDPRIKSFVEHCAELNGVSLLPEKPDAALTTPL